MQQISTSKLLVKHLYNETDATEALIVKDALETDASLQQEFVQMQETKYAIDEAGGDEPGSHVINNILAYSKETVLEMI